MKDNLRPFILLLIPTFGFNFAAALRCARRFAAVPLAMLLLGCASPAPGPVDSALGLVGLARTEVVERARVAREVSQSQPRRVPLRLHAGEVLNTDANGRGLSVVVRIYRLKSAAAFQALPYEAFLAAEPPAGTALRTEVLGMRELVLAPGQRAESVETLAPDVTHLAVVALFRSPAPQRWRFVFDTSTHLQSGVTLGVHGCALSVGTGEPLDAPAELRRVAGVRCG